MSSSLLLALLVNRTPTERLIQNLLNNPFAGIHQLAWFDWAILIPYFAILVILSIYGLHRFDTIRTYFKHRKKAHQRTAAQAIRAAAAGHHSASALQRAVRGGAADRRDREDRLSARAAADPGAGRFHRRHRIRSPRRCANGTAPSATRSSITIAPIAQGYKAGALQEGLKTATGEFVAIFDADFIPPPDFLTAHDSSLRRSEGRRGADAVELSEPRLQFPDRSGGDAARRPLHSRARRALARGLLLQFQRHGRHSARVR